MISPPLGIIMLDTAFERPPGDVGNAASWPFPVRLKTVASASARRIVDGEDADLIDAFVTAGEALAAEGAIGLITSCGFLAIRQAELAARLSVPIATSSLLQLPMIERCLPKGRRVGVVTYDADALTDAHFSAVGANPATARIGLPAGGALRGLIERGEPYRSAELQREVLAAVRTLLDRQAGIGAILFECTNLPPFSAAVSKAFSLPVYDVLTMGAWFYQGLMPGQLHAGASRRGAA